MKGRANRNRKVEVNSEVMEYGATHDPTTKPDRDEGYAMDFSA